MFLPLSACIDGIDRRGAILVPDLSDPLFTERG